MSNMVDKYAVQLQDVARSAWRDARTMTRQQLEDLKHDADGRKLTDPSTFARMSAHIVETVCICELQAREEGRSEARQKV